MNTPTEPKSKKAQLVVRAERFPRKEWEAKFAKQCPTIEDAIDIEPLVLTSWEETDWEW